ncbi:cytochrome P450 [Nemania sp. FL0031]|nr:cytochrome P450 [Nemania sp. FL0031]
MWPPFTKSDDVAHKMIPHLVQILISITLPQVIALVIGWVLLLSLLSSEKPAIIGAPVHGRRWRWEPTLWLQSRFTFGSRKIIADGYTKDHPFILKRYDVNLTILPHRYLEELRLVPESKLSAAKAHAQNSGHKWTGATVFAESHLHVQALLHLTTDLSKYLEVAKTELEYAWPIHLPSSKDWQEFDIQDAMRKLFARLFASVFVGHPVCRNEEWLSISVGFAFDMLTTAFTIRVFPTWLHPLIARLVPARYRIAQQVRAAHRILEPLVKEHADITKRKTAGEDVIEEDTLLNWMIDNGSSDENTMYKIAMRQLLLTVVSIHTTVATFTNLLFDLCAHPEWIPILREEVETVTKELGLPMSTQKNGLKQWLRRLEKLDSFIVESQRMSPVLLLGPQRQVLEPLTLGDGTYIPQGSRICWAGYNHTNNPTITPNPGTFDPMRSYVKRHSSPDQMNKHLAGQTHPDNLSFGYGKAACPGRQFAVNEIKMVMAKFITEYDFKFVDGHDSRPKTIDADEFTFTDPKAKIMIRLRKGGGIMASVFPDNKVLLGEATSNHS